MPVFSYVLQKVSRWELPSRKFSRREVSPPLSSGSNLTALDRCLTEVPDHCSLVQTASLTPEALLNSSSRDRTASLTLEAPVNNSSSRGRAASLTLEAPVDISSGRGRAASLTLEAPVKNTNSSGRDRTASLTLEAPVDIRSGQGRAASLTLEAPVKNTNSSGRDRTASLTLEAPVKYPSSSGRERAASLSLEAPFNNKNSSSRDRAASLTLEAPIQNNPFKPESLTSEATIESSEHHTACSTTKFGQNQEQEILFSDIMDQLMSPLGDEMGTDNCYFNSNDDIYIPCNCYICDCSCLPCKCKPCPHAWLDWRLANRSVSVLSHFKESTLKSMLFCTQLTAATALEIFGLKLPICGSVYETEMLLRHLQNEYQFTIVCEDCSAILSTYVISGGARKKKSSIGRRHKQKSKMSKHIPHHNLLDGDEAEAEDDDNVDDSVLFEDAHDSSCETAKESHKMSKQAQYRNTEKGKAAEKKYRSSDKGKKSNAKHCETYSKKDYGKEKRNAATKTYSQQDYGKEKHNAASKTYSKQDYGKKKSNAATKSYSKKDYGKKKRNAATKSYSKKDYGKERRKAANYSYSHTDKRRASYKRSRNSAKKKQYMNQYMPYFRECEKIHMDFSAENKAGNTKLVQEHKIRPEFVQHYCQFQSEILNGRFKLSAPSGYATNGIRHAAAFYKLTLCNMIQDGLKNYRLDNESWITIPGISKKVLKRKHFNLQNKAAMYLAERAWFKRQQCITALKIQHNRLSSLAEAITSKMAIQEKNDDQKSALLGLQGHKKTSEPLHTSVSYIDGIPYNYVAEATRFEEAKSFDKKNKLHITYQCNDLCILPNEEDLTNLRDLVDQCAKLGDKSSPAFREFLHNFQSCSKWEEFSEEEKNDLNPNRMYLFPVKHRNHPQECYMPQKDKNDPSPHIKCSSGEITIRKLMVHFENPRKFYSIISKAITAHKVLCDIDASTVMGDIEYLAKLIKIKLTYDDASVGFTSQSEAREWTSQSIEEKMAEVAVKGKTTRTTFSHRDVFDKNRRNLPSKKCYCCDKLVTPKQSSTIDLNTAKKLKYDPENGTTPHPVFEQLLNFLVDNGIIAQNSVENETGAVEDEF